MGEININIRIILSFDYFLRYGALDFLSIRTKVITEPIYGMSLQKKCQPLNPESCSLLTETAIKGQVNPSIPNPHKNINEYNCILYKSSTKKPINGIPNNRRSLKVPWNPILTKDSTYPIQEEWNISNAM